MQDIFLDRFIVTKLPNDSLKRKFYELVNNGKEYDSEQLQLNSFLDSRVLQDYQREDLSTGLIKIRFWHGCTKVINVVPVVGIIFFGVARLVQDTSWKELYFDSNTGDLLSSTLFNAASKLNDKGREHLNNKNYEAAIEYFHKAYLNNHGNNRNDAIYLTNKAIALYSQGNYDISLAEANKALEKDSSYQSAKDQRTKAAEALIKNALNPSKELYIIKRFDHHVLYKELNEISVEFLNQSILDLSSLVDSGSNNPSVSNRLRIAKLKLKRYNLKCQLNGNMEISNLLKEMASLIDDEIKIYNEMNLKDASLRSELKQLEDELLNNQELNRTDTNLSRRTRRVNLNDLAERVDKTAGKLEKEIVKEALSRNVQAERG